MARQHLLATTAIGTLAVLLAFVPGSSPQRDSSTPTLTDTAQSSMTLSYRIGDRGPAAGATVKLTLSNGRIVDDQLDSLGQYPVPSSWLPVRVEVHLDGWCRHSLELDEHTPHPAEAIILTPGARLDGIIVNAEGQPLVGAEIHARPGEPEASSGNEWTTRTNEAGHFSFSTLPPGPTWVHASHDTYGSEETLLEARTEGGTEARITLQRASLVSGRILLPNGDPAEGAEILFAGSGAWPARSVEADASGSFQVPNLPAGVYSFRAVLGDLTSTTRDGVILDSGERLALEMQLVTGVYVRGQVIDHGSSAPIAQARVIATEAALSIMPSATETSSDGSFSLGPLAPRGYRVRVMSPNYVPHEVSYRHGLPPLEIRLTQACTLRGRVVDEGGNPVPGASLHVQADSSAPTLSSSLSANRFSREVFQQHRHGGVPLRGGALGVTLGAVPPIPVSPASGSSSTLAAGTGLSDARGFFTLRGQHHGRLRVQAAHPDFASGLSEFREIGPGSNTEGWTVVLRAGASLVGRVVDNRGFPVANVSLRASSEGSLHEQVTTSASDGTFIIHGLAGPTTLIATAVDLPALQQEYDLTAGESREIELSLPEALIPMNGRILTRSGFPISGAKLTLQSLQRDFPTRRWTLTAEDGTFQLNGLPPAPYRIEVDHPDYAVRILSPVPQPEDELQVTLDPGGSLELRIIDGWESSPAGGALVTVRGEDSRDETANPDGVVQFQRLPPGDYVLTVTRRGSLPARVQARIPESDRERMEITLPPLELEAAGSIRGEARDQYGEPVANAEVTWRSPPNWDDAPRTGADGAFLLTEVPPGAHRLTVRHASAGTATLPSPIRVRPREELPGVFIRLPGVIQEDSPAISVGTQEGVALSLENNTDGVAVLDVAPDSSPANAAIEPGDQLVSVDDEPVFSAAHGEGMLRTPLGQEHTLQIRRGNRTFVVQVRSERYSLPPSAD